MKPQINQILKDLQIILESDYPHWRVDNITEIGKGLEALVLQADSSEFGEIAIKIPWKRWIENDNDNGLDAREFLLQEMKIATHLHQCGVPVPRIHALHTGSDDFDFLVSSLISNDQTPFEYINFGKVVRSLRKHAPGLLLTDVFSADIEVGLL